MDPWRKLHLGNQADPITRRCNAVRLRQAESKVWNLDILADFFGQLGKEFFNNVVRGESVQFVPLKELLANHSPHIDIEKPGMRHAFGHSLRFPVKNLEGPNHCRVLIAQERKVDLVPVSKVLQDCRAVVADGSQLDPLLLKPFFRFLQLDELRFAERSPISGPEEEKNCPVHSPQGLV